MKLKLLVLQRSVDGGTGTYAEGLLGLKKMFKPGQLIMKVLVLEKPLFRTINIREYSFFSQKREIPDKYSLNRKNIQMFIREGMWFKKAVQNFKPDIVLSSDPHSILISEAVRSLFNLKYKTISVIHNNLTKVINIRLGKYLRKPVKYSLALFLNKSDAVVTVAKKMSRDLSRDLKLRKIPTSIGEILPARYFEKRTAVETRGKEIVISTARLDVQKDHVTLLRAFKIVANKIPNSELWLVGDGPLKNQLKSLAEKLGISQRVKFFGWVQNPTKLLDSSKVFVLSTKWEGLPLSILEAMAGGIPVVASNCNYGPSEIIGKNKYGILVPVGNSNALAEAIVKLLSDGTKRKHYSNMAKIRAADFLQEKILTKYIKILEELFNIRYNRPDTFISEI